MEGYLGGRLQTPPPSGLRGGKGRMTARPARARRDESSNGVQHGGDVEGKGGEGAKGHRAGRAEDGCVTVTWARNYSVLRTSYWHTRTAPCSRSKNSWWRLLFQARWARRKAGAIAKYHAANPGFSSGQVGRLRGGHAQRQW